MQFFLGSRISPHMARLKDGVCSATSVPLCRTGTQHIPSDGTGKRWWSLAAKA